MQPIRFATPPRAPGLAEPVYEALKSRIMAIDVYAPDAPRRMDERGLAEQLGTSRTPVRAALGRLEQEGFVETLPRRGVFIRQKSLAEVRQMLEMWAALEAAAARMACARASEAEVDALAAHLATAPAGRLSEYSEGNIRFHRAVLALSGNPLMIEAGDGLIAHLAAVRRRAAAEPARTERSMIDHGAIVGAIRRREPDVAARSVEAHTARLVAWLSRNWATLTGNPQALSAEGPGALAAEGACGGSGSGASGPHAG
ncbi:MAG: GntR family transcriptional regulator [Pseudomonadota bacterium]